MFNNLVRKKGLVLMTLMLVSLLLVVGCSSSGEELETTDQAGKLKLEITGIENTTDKDLQTLVAETSNKIEVVIENDQDEVENYKKTNDLENSNLEFAFDNLKSGTEYQVKIKIKDDSGQVLSGLKQKSITIAEDSITEAEIDLNNHQLVAKDMNQLGWLSSNQAKIYYKRGFATPYIHYAINGSWTDVPGVAMQDSEYDGYSVSTIDLGTATELEAAFNDGGNNWDSNGGSNYFFQDGTWTFDAGNITSGAPESTEEPSSELPDIPSDKVNQTMYQAFYWNMDGGLWTQLQSQATDFAEIGITSMWLPPATKAWGGEDGADGSVGYDVHDFWDLGEFYQNGSVGTKYGTKADLEGAISALHSEGIKAYTDTVFNHRMGADGTDNVDGKEVWTNYTLDGRDKYYNSDNYPYLYHDFDWNYNVFDSANGDLFSFKSWDVEDDYLMGADVDYQHTWVVDEMKAWGQWIINDVNFDGFRLDAVKHVRNEFVGNWLDDVQSNTSKDVFAVGEAWIENTSDLEGYLDQVGNSDLRVFDFPLRNSFVELSSGDKDLGAWGAWNGLVHERPSQAVTFVDNHDTCREGNPYGKPQVVNFKNQAYAYMLMRENGVPTVYARDYTEFNMSSTLDKMVKARRYFAYGAGHEVSNNSHDVYSYVREGLADVAGDGLVMMISDGTSGNTATKNINSRQPNTTFYDFTGNVSGTVTTDANGYGDFSVNKSESNGWAIWVPTNN
jgi:alpha-amylase